VSSIPDMINTLKQYFIAIYLIMTDTYSMQNTQDIPALSSDTVLSWKDRMSRKHDAHLHELFKVVRSMWKNWELSRCYSTANPAHSRLIGALDMSNNSLWEKIGRKSPFELVREKMQTEKCHVSNKRVTFPGYTTYIISVVEFDPTKVEQKNLIHQETTDEKFARGCRMHDAMKHEFEACVIEMCRIMRETNASLPIHQSLTWNISSDCDKNARVTGAVDMRNTKVWEHIGRKSPFEIVFSKMKNEYKCHVSSRFINNVLYGDRHIVTFAITVQEYAPKTVTGPGVSHDNVPAEEIATTS
jgi:hypothetical protein